MVKKIQRQFVLLTTAILTFVFLVLGVVAYSVLHNSKEQTFSFTAKNIYETFYKDYSKPTPIDVSVAPNCVIFTSNNDLYYDVTSYTETQAKEISDDIKNVLIKYSAISNIKWNTINGENGNFYYQCFNTNETIIIVAFNNEEINGKYLTSVLIFTIILITLYLILGLITVLFSYRIIEPLKETFDKQKQFINDASHELKTPITIISANVDVLKEQNENQWLNNIENQVENAENLISDMLSLAKAESNAIPLKKVETNLSDLINGCILPFEEVLFEKKKTLETYIDNDVYYKVDVESVKKTVSILMDNAIKHSYLENVIKISLKQEGNKPVLSFYNTGSDVPNEDSEKIFERFYRSDSSRSRETGGSGLGLSIAKNIADNNKWKINATSVLDAYMLIKITF